MKLKNNEKIILGYRDKIEIKKGAILTTALVLLFGALALASLFLLVKGKLGDKLIGVGVDFALFGLMFLFYLRYVKKQNKLNSYPVEAIYYEDGFICIAEEEIIRINILNIKKIKEVSDSTDNKNTTGMVVIATNDNKKYNIVQIKDVKNVVKELNDLHTKYVVKEYNKEVMKQFEEKIENARTDESVKKIEFENLLFIYDDALKQFETITTIKGVKVKLSFYEGIDEEQNISIKTIKTIIKGFDKFYKKVLKNLTDDLIENANDWNDEDKEITREEFIERVDQKYIEISVTEEDYEIFFEDDGIFHGHTIVYNGNVENEDFYTDIAG